MFKDYRTIRLFITHDSHQQRSHVAQSSRCTILLLYFLILSNLKYEYKKEEAQHLILTEKMPKEP